jgi:hypothetical protein
MLYYWQADFESGNAGDYLEFAGPAPGPLTCISPGLVSGSTYAYRLGGFPGNNYWWKTIAPLSEFYFTTLFRASDNSNPGTRLVKWRSVGTLPDYGEIASGANTLWGASVGGVGVASSVPPNNYIRGQIVKLELYVRIADVGGRIRLKQDDNIFIDFTGDTKPGASSTINQFEGWGGMWNYVDWDNIYLTDEPVRQPMFVSFM